MSSGDTVRKFLPVAAMILIAAGPVDGDPPATADAEGPLIRIGDREVSREEYTAYLLEKFGPRAVDRFVTDLLVKEEALRRRIEATGEEMAAWVARTVKENRENSNFFPWLQSQGLDLDTYERVVLPAEAETQVLIEKMLRSDWSSEEGLRRMYEQRYGVRYKVRVILIRDDAALTRAVEVWARGLLAEARTRLESGESFESLAKEYSEAPDAEVGGDLGFFERGRYHPALEDAIFALEPGEVGGPVESDFGFHLVEATDRREEEIRARHILIRSYQAILRDSDPTSSIEKRIDQDVLDSIRQRSRGRARKILDDLLLGADFGTVAAQESVDRSARRAGEVGPFRIGSGDFPAAVEKAIQGLEKGKIAGPIVANLGAYLVRLDSRQGSEATFEEVREDLEEGATNGPIPGAEVSRFVQRLREGIEVIQRGELAR